MDDRQEILTRPTINPYRRAVRYFFEQLYWDLTPEAWYSRNKLKSLRNSFLNKKAVIMCNGPSLNQVGLSELEGCFTFGLNKINLLFKKSDFRPSCIVSINELVIEQNQKFFNETQIPLFINSAGRKKIKSRENVTFLKHGPEGFARDCSMTVPQGHTVTYVAMQLAYHMGFNDVALVGCDHSFAVKGPSNKKVVSESDDASHFDPNYFSKGVQWELPDLIESERAYLLAKKIYEQTGRRIVNCTAGGELNLFKRMDLNEFLSKKYNHN